MIDMLQNAKDLIAKGKALNDPELLQMGMDLLNKYSSDNVKENEPQYVCDNCGYTMLVDREGRKQCPECKKHKLRLYKPTPTEKPNNNEQQTTPKTDTSLDQFHMQVRSKNRDRTHYDDDGNPDGLIRKIETVDPNTIHNVWQDDGEVGQDAANEQLKKFTTITKCTRRPPQKIDVECTRCHKKEKVHPMHVGRRSYYICVKCARRSHR